MERVCSTRAIKNAKGIRKVDPHIIPAQEPAEGFKSLVPFDVLSRFHRIPEAELAHRPELLAAKRKMQPRPTRPTGPAEPGGPAHPRLFGAPPFKGTVHFVQMTFTEGGTSTTVTTADVMTAIRYATLAAPAISTYSKQYGDNSLTISQTILQFSDSIKNGRYNDDDLQRWVNTILQREHLKSDSTCIVLLNPPGLTNVDGDRADGVGGYHDQADTPYCFVNLFGTGLTVADLGDFYADTLSHELAEMTCDPDVSIFNDEVCDACAGNCHNSWRNFFVDPSASLANSYLGSSKTFPPGFAFTYFIAAIAKRDKVGDCPAADSACGYGPEIHVGRSELLFYDRSGGVGEFYSVDGHADIGIQTNHGDWRKSWSLIARGNFAAKLNPHGSNLLFYEQASGVGEFYKSDGSGHISLLGPTHTDWNRNWTHIVPGHFSDNAFADLLFYARSTGVGDFWHTDGKGGISRLGPSHTGWRQSWLVIIPGKFSDSKYTDLLFYDPGAGTGEFWHSNGKGEISLFSSHKEWRTSWTQIIPGKFSDGKYTDLLFYEPATGTGEFWRIDGHGKTSLIGANHNWRKDWSLIVPGNFSGGKYTDLLFYEQATGTGEFWRTDGHGNVSLIKAYGGWRTSWAAILQP